MIEDSRVYDWVISHRATIQRLKHMLGWPCRALKPRQARNSYASKMPSRRSKTLLVRGIPYIFSLIYENVNGFCACFVTEWLCTDTSELLADCIISMGKWHFVNESPLKESTTCFERAAEVIRKTVRKSSMYVALPIMKKIHH